MEIVVLTKAPLPKFESRRPVSDLDYVYSALKQSCMIGEFEPGQKLTLPQLAEAFGTSQMPVREASNRLIAARAMEAPPRRSLRIPDATVERLEKLLPLRLLLESEATREAAAGPNAALADQLQSIHEDLDALALGEDRKPYLRQNQLFHFTLYAAAGNNDLLDLIELLWMRYGPLMGLVTSGELSSKGHAHHATIVEAVRRGDPEAAAAALRIDITDAAKMLRQAIADKKQAAGTGST